MAMGIGQQIKGMVDRARHYWAELTDEKESQQRAQAEREESLHQRYGGIRGQDESDIASAPHDRPERPSDREHPGVRQASPTPRRGQSAQMGGQQDSERQMQGSSQTQRQYTQQGGSGIQKTLGEQLGDNETGPGKSGPQQSRRSWPKDH